MNILIVENNTDDLAYLKNTLLSINKNQIYEASTLLEAIECVENHEIDLIIMGYILDKGNTAMQIVSLPGLSLDVKVITLINALDKKIIYEMNSIRPTFFIEKGFHVLALAQTIDYLENMEFNISKQQVKMASVIFVKVGKVYRKIRLEDIYYFEVDGKYVNICLNERTYALRTSMKKLEQKVIWPFIKVHSAYMVNCKRMEFFQPSKSIIQMNNGKVIPLSRNFKSNLFDFLLMP